MRNAFCVCDSFSKTQAQDKRKETQTKRAVHAAAPTRGSFTRPLLCGVRRSGTRSRTRVEYTNTFDFWYENASSRFHGGMITDVDAMAFMTQLNYSVPGSWCVFSMEVLGLST